MSLDTLLTIIRAKRYHGRTLHFCEIIIGLDGAPSALRFADFIGAHLANLQFKHSKFSTNFTEGMFQNIEFTNCTFDRVLMIKSRWQKCSFINCGMIAEMTDAQFEDCSFTGTHFKGIGKTYGGRRSRFLRCDFSDCVFHQVQFLAGRLVNCNLSRLRIVKSDLRGTFHNGLPLY